MKLSRLTLAVANTSPGLNSQSLNPPIDVLRQSAALVNALRAHFLGSNALEVHTPALSRAGITDPNIHSLMTEVRGSGQQYLHTSPEFAMKRLLAAGSGDIYQICTVFRDGERGRLHLPEFRMCEWYRVGADHHQLMREVDGLLQQLWQKLAAKTAGQLEASHFVSYTTAIESACDLTLSVHNAAALEPVNAKQTKSLIQNKLQQSGFDNPLDDSDTVDDWLDLLMTLLVFPTFPQDRFTFLYDYPASQAALARTGLNTLGDTVAQRFEIFFGTTELANGFHELRCAKEQRRRFEHELQRRKQLGLQAIPIDEALLCALENGFPDCAGVAIGLERLLMVLHGADSIANTLSLGAEHA